MKVLKWLLDVLSFTIPITRVRLATAPTTRMDAMSVASSAGTRAALLKKAITMVIFTMALTLLVVLSAIGTVVI